MRLVLLLLLCPWLLCCEPQVKQVETPLSGTLIPSIDSNIDADLHYGLYDKAIAYLDSLHPTFMGSHHPTLSGIWLTHRGNTFRLKNEFDSARKYLLTAIAAFDKGAQQSIDYKARSLAAMGSLYADLHQYDSALDYNLRASSIARQKDTGTLVGIYKNLALLYSQLGDDINQRKYLLEGYQLATNHVLFPIFANNIAKYYVDKNEIDSAALYFYRSLADSVNVKDEQKAVIYENLGVLLALQGNNEQGLHYLEKALAIYKKEGLADGNIYLSIAEIYSRMGNMTISNNMLDAAYKSTDDEEKGLRSEIHYKKADNLMRVGNYTAAYHMLEKAFLLHEQHDSSSILKQAQEIETRYAVKEKEDKIRELDFKNQVNDKIRRQQLLIMALMTLLFLVGIGAIIINARRKKQQLVMREATLQQQLLRSQLSSHFLFNSFTILLQMLEEGRAYAARDFLLNLCTLTRITLDNARLGRAPLGKEIMALESYLALCTYHLPGRFTYTIHLFEGHEQQEIYIPPMLLQPFVENAIFHGIAPMADGGHISISIEKTNQTLYCVIDDNGIGLRRATQKPTPSLSTIITQERLEILHRQSGRPASLTITDKTKEGSANGVRVCIQIPFNVYPA